MSYGVKVWRSDGTLKLGVTDRSLSKIDEVTVLRTKLSNRLAIIPLPMISANEELFIEAMADGTSPIRRMNIINGSLYVWAEYNSNNAATTIVVTFYTF